MSASYAQIVDEDERTNATIVRRELELLKHDLVAVLLQLLGTIRFLCQEQICLLWVTLS